MGDLLGWTGYVKNRTLDWSRILIGGDSEGAGQAVYMAYQRPVYGAISFAGPQGTCNGMSAWSFLKSPVARKNTLACYSANDAGKTDMDKNLHLFQTHHAVTTQSVIRSYGQGLWCASPDPDHCATSVDDQLVQEAVDKCFVFLRSAAADLPEISAAMPVVRISLGWIAFLLFLRVGA